MEKAALNLIRNANGKEFCVRNIPGDFIDWDLFRIFYKYGTVRNVKIPSNQTNSNNKYGFVVMEDLNGADEVRSHLKNGIYLVTDNGVKLLISFTLNGEERFSCDNVDDYRKIRKRTSKKLNIMRVAVWQKKQPRTDKPNARKVYEFCGAVKWLSQDLPLRTAIKVRVVDSPQPCQCIDDGFIFHVIPINQKLGEEYTVLQQEMSKYCMKNPNLKDPPKVGQYALFSRDNIAYRALCISDLTMYLVDTGEVVPMELSQLWSIDNAFAELPSLVVPCGISEITWTNPSTDLFNSCRNAVRQWSDRCVNGLTATTTMYSGLVNIIDLEAFSDGVVENFAASLRRKGLCTRMPRVHHYYSREILLRIRNSIKADSSTLAINFSHCIAEITTGLEKLFN